LASGAPRRPGHRSRSDQNPPAVRRPPLDRWRLHAAGTAFAGNAAAIKVSNDLVAELKSADHIVIGTPMYNFSIPAVLKAYIDHIVRVGVTVSSGNVGLLTGKKATVILATGGDFSPGSPVEGYNQASGYLRQVLGYIGITDVEIILAGRPRAGTYGETAVEQFGDKVEVAAVA
jgi:FMN-dependent NADH-azoreductase